jgi:hypothetical protein
VNVQQLPALFAEHRTAVLGAGAAAVVGLAVWQKKKGASSSTAATTAGAKVIPGTIPAAAVVPAGGTGSGSYDSSASDVYSALSQQIESLRQTQGPSVTDAPAPIASTLFAPSGSGQWIVMPNGVTGEIESDGSIFGASADQFHGAGGVDAQRTPIQQNVNYYDTNRNVVAATAAKA